MYTIFWRGGTMFFFVLLFSINVFAQNGFSILQNFCTDTTIQSTVGYCLADSGKFYLYGVTKTANVSPMHGYLAVYNYTGKLIWTRKLLFPSVYNTYSAQYGIAKIDTDKYMVIGTAVDYNINPNISIFQPYFYIFKNNGDSIFFKEYIDSFRRRYYTAVLHDRHSIMTAGTISSKGIHAAGSTYDYDYHSLWLCKYDYSGNVIWQKSYIKTLSSSSPIPYADKIILSPDGMHYVISGYMRDTILNVDASCIIKTDTSGTLIWLKSLAKPYLSWNHIDIVANPSGGYYFVSSYSTQPPSTAGDPQYSNIYYGKLNEDGDTLWTRKFSDSLHYALGYHIAWASDKKHLIIHASGNVETIPAIIKIDTLGNVDWYRMVQHVYNTAQPWHVPNQVLNCMSVTPDERYLMAGYINGGPITGVYDTSGTISWITLIDSNGCRYQNDPACWPLLTPLINKDKPEVYPNPINDLLYITIYNNNSTAAIINITGEVIFATHLQYGKNTFDLKSLQKGMYFLKVVDNRNTVSIMKIIKT